MSRKLRRVPLDFSWPLNKTWKGFINPYWKLRVDCKACNKTGYSPEAKRFSDEWYGYVPFDPVAYGAKPLTVDHPRIRAMAVRNVNNSPEYYMTFTERMAEKVELKKAGVDLMELYKAMSNDELAAKLDAPAGEIEDLQQPGVVVLGKHRLAAVEREQKRLFEVCFRGHWSHHLIQADVDALVENGRLWSFTRTPRNAAQAFVVAFNRSFHGMNSWLTESNGYHPTAEEINDWSIGGMGHDSINSWVCIEARCKREGFEKTCRKCEGHGHGWEDVDYDELPYLTEGLLSVSQLQGIVPTNGKISGELAKKLHDDWEDYEPPTGEGFQLWEDVSEGSPITPVFATLDELCEYAAENCTTFADNKVIAEEWKKMLDAGFVYHKERMGDGSTGIFM